MNNFPSRPGASNPNGRTPTPSVPQHQYQAQHSSASSPWYPPPVHVSQYQSQSQGQSFPPPQWGHGRTHSMSLQNYPAPPGPPPGETPPSDGVKGPLSTEEDIQRLFKICQAGQGSANLLHEALVYASPADLKDKDSIIQVRRSMSCSPLNTKLTVCRSFVRNAPSPKNMSTLKFLGLRLRQSKHHQVQDKRSSCWLNFSLPMRCYWMHSECMTTWRKRALNRKFKNECEQSERYIGLHQHIPNSTHTNLPSA